MPSFYLLILFILNLKLIFVFTCPKNWILINSKCFLINKAPNSYLNNLQLCKKHGAFLMHDLNLNEIERLTKFIDKSAWIGHHTNTNASFHNSQANKFENNCIYLNKIDGIFFNERCSNDHALICYKQSILDLDDDDNQILNPFDNLTDNLFLPSNQLKRRGFSIRKKLFKFGKKNKANHKIEAISQSMSKIESELNSLKKQLRHLSKGK